LFAEKQVVASPTTAQGIHAADHEVIFDKFRQGSGGTDVLTDKPQGTGPWPADQPPDHRILQRPAVGRKRTRRRGVFPVHLAASSGR
jgi:hypothetical protein